MAVDLVGVEEDETSSQTDVDVADRPTQTIEIGITTRATACRIVRTVREVVREIQCEETEILEMRETRGTSATGILTGEIVTIGDTHRENTILILDRQAPNLGRVHWTRTGGVLR